MKKAAQKRRPTLGLALSGGSARGLAHIGVLKVFEEHGIPVDYLAGTSMGSLVGAFYACGMSLKMMERLAARMERRLWMDLTVPRMGIIAGEKITEILCFLTRNRTFADLNLPFAACATDLYSGRNITIREGRVADAVRASISIPGVFPPVCRQDYLLVDGGVLNRVPVDTVREMGAEVVVAVDVAHHVGEPRISNFLDVISQSIEIMSRELEREKISQADLLIYPHMEEVSPSQFHKVAEAVAAGAAAASQALPDLQRLLKRKGAKQ
jgi:NTE family protein